MHTAPCRILSAGCLCPARVEQDGGGDVQLGQASSWDSRTKSPVLCVPERPLACTGAGHRRVCTSIDGDGSR
jgi:hypothetical protein